MKIAVFCGSSSGNNPVYLEAARSLGKALARQQLDLVYGGAKVGLMGEVANSVIENGGRVFGVMPTALVEKEVAHQGLTELYIVKDMHERKSKMAELSDAFIAMPGGVGTMEEIFEAWTWAQLGYHQKPCCFLNVDGYYDHLLTFVDQMVSEGFLWETYRQMLQVSDSPQTLINLIESYQPPRTKWD